MTVIGVTIAIPFLHYELAFFSSIRSINTDSAMSWKEYIVFFLAYGIQYGWGVFNLFYLYDRKQMDPSIDGATPSGRFIVIYLIVIPFITSLVSSIAKWIDEKGKKLSVMLIV